MSIDFSQLIISGISKGSYPMFWVVLVAAVLVVFVAAIIIYYRSARKHENEEIASTARNFNMTPLRDDAQLEDLSSTLAEIFSDVAMYVRELRIVSAYVANIRGYTVRITHVVFGMDRGNSKYTIDKVAVLVSEFDKELPEFSLTPRSPREKAFRVPSDQSIFSKQTALGTANAVYAKDAEPVRALLDEQIQEKLSDNEQLVLVSRGNLLAYYPDGESVVPDDLNAFVEQSLDLTDMLVKH